MCCDTAKFIINRRYKNVLVVKTYIHEAALNPSGKAAAVKSTEANSYDLAFHVDRKWQRNKLYLVQSSLDPSWNIGASTRKER